MSYQRGYASKLIRVQFVDAFLLEVSRWTRRQGVCRRLSVRFCQRVGRARRHTELKRGAWQVGRGPVSTQSDMKQVAPRGADRIVHLVLFCWLPVRVQPARLDAAVRKAGTFEGMREPRALKSYWVVVGQSSPRSRRRRAAGGRWGGVAVHGRGARGAAPRGKHCGALLRTCW